MELLLKLAYLIPNCEQKTNQLLMHSVARNLDLSSSKSGHQFFFKLYWKLFLKMLLCPFSTSFHLTPFSPEFVSDIWGF